MVAHPMLGSGNNATNSAVHLSPDQKKKNAGVPSVFDVADPLESVPERERLALAIRFGGIRMCAALSHGHSFESSIFRLPAKCLACQELVWGPFTRGCVCLVCKLTVHRSCTGTATMPKCPTMDLFADFCRSELGLRRPAPRASFASDGQEGVLVSAPKERISNTTSTHAQQERANGGDLDGWATVEGATANGTDKRKIRTQDSAFSWSPFGSSDRKRLIYPNTSSIANNKLQQQQQLPEAKEHVEDIGVEGVKDAGNAKVKPKVVSPPLDRIGGISDNQSSDKSLNGKVHGADLATASVLTPPKTSTGIKEVGKMSVAGGVVGAVLGGTVGAMVGLKVGAVVGAGRWSVQGLWKRIEEDRHAAGATAGLTRLSQSLDRDDTATPSGGEGEEGVIKAGFQDTRDVWARIAHQVQEEQPSNWELDHEQQALLEHGECDEGEVATFFVGKLLADETAMPSRLYVALLDEFWSRHRVCNCRRPVRRPSGVTDMVAIFPRVGGSRRGSRENVAGGDDESNPAFRDDGGTFSASTSGLEKTFSFVEEAEIVEGEESDAASGDFAETGYSSGVEGVDVRNDEGLALEPCNVPVSVLTPRRTVEVATAFAPAEIHAAASTASAAVASRESSSRNNSCRLDSWVRLEENAYLTCGSGMAGVASQTRMTAGHSVRDVDDEEGGLEDSWAATEASSCWCTDEGELSTSPEIIDVTPTQGLPTGGSEDLSLVGNREYSSEETVSLLDPQGRKGTNHIDPSASKSGREAASLAHGAENRASQATQTNGQFEVIEKKEACDALRDVHGVLRELTRAVLSSCPMITTSEEAAIQAVNCIDQRVLGETYGPVYARVASGQACEQDSALAHRVRRGEHARREAGQPSLVTACEIGALAALRSAGNARTGRDKLEFLVQAVERISGSLPPKATTDVLLWSLCRHLAAATMDAGWTATRRAEMWGRGNGGKGGSSAPLPRPHAEVAFVEQFMRDESWVMGKQGYVLTTVYAALHALLDPVMSEEVFLDSPATVEGDDVERARG